MKLLLAFFFCLGLLDLCRGIPLEDFYPYGTDADSELPRVLDDGRQTNLSSSFPFFGRTFSSLFVNTNGVISFLNSFLTFTPLSFPLSASTPLISPFWSDVDIRTNDSGNIYYRDASLERDQLLRAQRDIMTYFASGRDFQPRLLFIATWDGVRQYFGQNNNRSNTFQCVLTSDGQRSYVIFLYADDLIEWTSGDDSNGVDAQVGFNAGDRVTFASVPGSLTDDIMDITTTSNVGIGGAWTFRVDQEETPRGSCGPTNILSLSPTSGNMLGGTVILLTGPCFDSPAHVIQCVFNDSVNSGHYLSERVGYCVSPHFDSPGWKSLQVTISDPESEEMLIYSRSSRFYARPVKEVSDVSFVNMVDNQGSNVLVAPGNTLHVTWNPTALFRSADPRTLQVDIHLSRFELSNSLTSTPRSSRVTTLLSDEANDGMATIQFPTIPSENFEVMAISIEIVVRTILDGGLNLEGAVQVAKLWSRIFFNDAGRSQFSANCQTWIARQPAGISDIIRDRVVPCPPTLLQARTINSGLTDDVTVTDSINRMFFNRGTDTCFRQTDPITGHGQQCCYTGGQLTTGSPTGGTVDKISPDINVWGHIREDLIPYIYCCKGPQSSCLDYFEHRPSDNGSQYNPPFPACVFGDPHIVTLDGYKYTFNGRGEFILIQTPDNRFTLQGRMVPAVDNETVDVEATVFSALAARERYSSVVQFQLTEDEMSIEMLVDGELVDFTSINRQQFMNVTVADLGSNSLSATFSSGVYIEARASNSIISTLLVSASPSYRGQTQGLMGNFNGVTSDDLIARGQTAGIPISSNLEEIHTFGLSWIINNEAESLFMYGNNESFADFYHPDFTPAFVVEFIDPELELLAQETCGNDQFCLFDIAATGRVEIGLGTAQANLEFETIVNVSTPATCSPACINGVCVAENTCSCTSGYQGIGCTQPVTLPCDVNPCSNGGSCLLQAGSYVCTCPQGYSGIRCQIPDQPVTTQTVSTERVTSSGLMATEEAFTEFTSEEITSDTPPETTAAPTDPDTTPTVSTAAPTDAPETTASVSTEAITESQTTPTILVPFPGSGSSVTPDCSCDRIIECSTYATFVSDDGSTVIAPSSRFVRCGIGSVGVPTEPPVLGEAGEMLGMGSGLMAAPASPAAQLFVDTTFEVTSIAPGSFLFLREIGLISRTQGLVSCSFQGSSVSDVLLADYLNLDSVTIVYENSLGQYRRITVDRNNLDQPESLPPQDLDMSQQCAALKITQALNSGSLLQQQYFCRNDGSRETIAVFTVPCN